MGGSTTKDKVLTSTTELGDLLVVGQSTGRGSEECWVNKGTGFSASSAITYKAVRV